MWRRDAGGSSDEALRGPEGGSERRADTCLGCQSNAARRMECRVAYTDLRTCLINVPGTLLGAISKPVQQCLVEVRASAPNGPVVVAGLSGFSSVAADESTVEIDAGFARANQLDDGSLVTCRISEAVPRATSIHVAPRTPDDWELMVWGCAACRLTPSRR